MFRRLMLSAILGTGLMTGMTLTPATADAHPPEAFHHDYEVLYRHRGCWEVYRVYRESWEADQAAHRLRHDGFEVDVRRI
jgi:hypothetical protein